MSERDGWLREEGLCFEREDELEGLFVETGTAIVRHRARLAQMGLFQQCIMVKGSNGFLSREKGQSANWLSGDKWKRQMSRELRQFQSHT
mmetsp:Transcript_7046/g.26420  ORF Transcript_7046/g.26420 Transcript_7046/m.26420 type:complete len:90 (+) Transcript_7046:1170-1439(+)